MTRTDDFDLSLKLDLDVLIAAHGLRRVLLAALRAAVVPPPPGSARHLAELDDHLRRDIGLPPRGPAQSMPHWSHFGW